MGYKTITFSRQIEKRTYVQGEFTGKYHGIANDKILLSNTELYDIHIYEGEISNLKNDKEHSAIIDETIYNAIVSETQLTQKSFENVLINLNPSIHEYDSVRLEVIEPKLEAVQIFDVVKDGNKTFGTLTCLVSGYLLELETIFNEMQVETCDDCGQLIEECACKEITPVVFDVKTETETENGVIPEEITGEPFWKSIPRAFNKENRAKLWNEIQPSGLGCLGFIGLFLSILFLFSFGIPGLISGLFIGLLYLIGSFLGLFPALPYHWRQVFYAFAGILFIGLLLNLFKSDTFNNYRSNIDTKSVSKEENNNEYNYPNSSSSNVQETIPTNENEVHKMHEAITGIDNDYPQTTNEQPIEQTVTLYNDTIDSFYTNKVITPETQLQETPSTVLNTSDKNLTDSTGFSNSQIQETISNFDNQENNEQSNETDITNTSSIQNTMQPNVVLSSDETVNNNTEKSLTSLDTSSINLIERKKVKPLKSLMAGTVFQEGDIYICKEDDSKHYHLDQNCEALEDCTESIYQINIPEAERLGRSLCELEK
ncbi:hypothetical protein [Maribacter dokdonensis]|uniref:hypothetical protein n=2 Tax=Maribacter dokdonensis TaxID=320912 RepID=UPI0032975AAF